MAKAKGQIVAELGRPETPEETAARKANDSRLYRQRKTVNNLVFSLLVSLGAVLIIFLMVPREAGDYAERTVNISALAAESSRAIDRELIAPEVPETWLPRQAVLRTEGSITYWQMHYITENEAYATVIQAFDANGGEVSEAWVASKLENQDPTGTEQMAGADWTVYDHPDRNPDGANMVFGMEHTSADSTLLVFGTDRPEVLRMLALSAHESLEAVSNGR